MGKKLSLRVAIAGPSAVKSRAKWPQNFANFMCSAMYLSCVLENKCVTFSIAFRHVFWFVKSNSTVSSAPRLNAYWLLSRVAARIVAFGSFESNERTSFPTRPVEPVTRMTARVVK